MIGYVLALYQLSLRTLWRVGTGFIPVSGVFLYHSFSCSKNLGTAEPLSSGHWLEP